MSQPLLEGTYEDIASMPNTRDEELDSLSARVAELESSLAEAESRAKREAVVTVLNLLGAALRQVASGKIEMPPLDVATTTAPSSRWEAIKQRNPGRIAQAVDTLLVHGTMSVSNLASAMRMDRSNCSKNVVTKLRSMGLLVIDGTGFKLKDLG